LPEKDRLNFGESSYINDRGSLLMEIRRSVRLSVVAGWLGCGKGTLYQMIDHGELSGFTIGGRYYIYLDSVDSYQKRNGLDLLTQ